MKKVAEQNGETLYKGKWYNEKSMLLARFFGYDHFKEFQIEANSVFEDTTEKYLEKANTWLTKAGYDFKAVDVKETTIRVKEDGFDYNDEQFTWRFDN